MNFRTVFAVHQPVTSSTKCILQFWQRFSRTLEKSGGTSFAWCMNFCANRGLTCKMYGRVLKIDFVPVFNRTSRARICMNFQTVFADSQLVLSSTKCIRSWVRCTVLQKKNLNYRNSQLKISLVLKNSNEGCLRNSFWIFHARMHEIRKSEPKSVKYAKFTQYALRKTEHYH